MNSYRLLASNDEGEANSKTAKLYVLEKPAFVEQPKDVAFLTGKTGNLYADVIGSKPLSFEWFKNGVPWATTTSNKLTLRKMKAADHGGTYSVKVTNDIGEVTSEDFTVSVVEPVRIDANPTDTGVVSGQSGSLNVTASGGGVLTYQWMKYDAKTRKWTDVQLAQMEHPWK